MSLRQMHSLNRKKYKRATNALIRKFNKEIQNDWLWNGRFVMSQECAFFQPFEDHSGAIYKVFLILTDTKTKKQERTYLTNYELDWHMWDWANKCITDYWNVWKEDPNPNIQARLEGREPPTWR